MSPAPRDLHAFLLPLPPLGITLPLFYATRGCFSPSKHGQFWSLLPVHLPLHLTFPTSFSPHPLSIVVFSLFFVTYVSLSNPIVLQALILPSSLPLSFFSLLLASQPPSALPFCSLSFHPFLPSYFYLVILLFLSALPPSSNLSSFFLQPFLHNQPFCLSSCNSIYLLALPILLPIKSSFCSSRQIGRRASGTDDPNRRGSDSFPVQFSFHFCPLEHYYSVVLFDQTSSSYFTTITPCRRRNHCRPSPLWPSSTMLLSSGPLFTIVAIAIVVANIIPIIIVAVIGHHRRPLSSASPSSTSPSLNLRSLPLSLLLVSRAIVVVVTIICCGGGCCHHLYVCRC